MLVLVRVVGYDAYPNHSLSFLEYKETVEDAIKDADIISLHVPANKDSFHLFDNNMFKNVKRCRFSQCRKRSCDKHA